MYKIRYKKILLLLIIFLVTFINETLEEQPFPIYHSSKNNKKSNRTIIVSHFTIDNNKFIMPVINNHKQYAKKHGYDYWFRNGIIEPKFLNAHLQHIKKPTIFFGLYWQKLAAIKQAMDLMDGSKHKYKWILWLDGDAVFSNLNKSLEDLKKEINVTENQYLIIAKDMSCNKHNICPIDSCVNTGVILIHNNNKGRQFIQNIIDSFPIYKDHLFPEQAAFQDQVFGLMVRKNLKIKAYKYTGDNKCDLPTIPGVIVVDSIVMNSGYNKNWKSGHFIAHFTGLHNHNRGLIITKFLESLGTCTP